ncbi:RND family efflux transporter, MFP subunit [Luteibacter sp. UNCMF331Sha3.1]|uniref:efflux RND transporter periplasmic adaptor subunit n=1 Tax=Luteibacter sp. UNCMF331Sha3.1 TaxID=1502760 RepID=UPI0008B1F7D7|nr:HlyD family secretion protein [Luteibacter sp. UNCMF331Sha3.1]SEN11404.1 RND family efflux transporter, MFP subunit [Luteibacter sp. UNCMF331Sha3.1]
MSDKLRLALRLSLTILLVAGAAGAGFYLWTYYKVEPWTRNGRLRADTLQIAPDVTGLVTQVLVHDNQHVRAGDVMLVIDPERFALAERQADAVVQELDVQLRQARREDGRNRTLGDVVSDEVREQGRMKVDALEASRARAMAAVAVARLDVERTRVRAPVDGTVSNIELRPGDYATTGHPLFALIDEASLRVEGYFEETKLRHIHVGDSVELELMGDPAVFAGHVESIAGGIEDRDTVSSPRLLANVNPTFNWVRLAQRVPVRVTIDHPPPGVLLVAGRTVSVRVRPAPPAVQGRHP